MSSDLTENELKEFIDNWLNEHWSEFEAEFIRRVDDEIINGAGDGPRLLDIQILLRDGESI